MTPETFESILALFTLSSSSSPSSSSSSRPLDLCYHHQLYCLIPNRTRVDEDVKILSKEQEGNPPKIKMLYSHTSPSDTLLCNFNDYRQSIETLRDVIDGGTDNYDNDGSSICSSSDSVSASSATRDKKKEEMVKEKKLKVQAIDKFLVYAVRDNKMSVFGDNLRKGSPEEEDNFPSMTSKEIDLLNDLKLLVPRRDTYSSADCYWYSHPDVGQFTNRILKARAAILRRVKAMKYKEVAESLLEQKFMEGCSGVKGKGSKRKHASLLDDSHCANGAGYLINTSSPSVATLYSSSSFPTSSSLSTNGILAYGFKFHLFDLVGKESLTRCLIPSMDNQKKYMIRLPPS